jgi:general secretion pathway protein A
LEQIRILSNLETNKEKLLQIILVGQLGLIDVLKSEQLRQLDQRIASRYQIGPLQPVELPRYIHHRLLVAGSKGGIQFSGAALQMVYQYSRGFPRLINLLCDRSLMSGFAAQSHHISKEMVKKAVETLDLPGTAPAYVYKLRGESLWNRYRRALVACLAFFAFAVAILIFWSHIASAVGTVWSLPKTGSAKSNLPSPVQSPPSSVPASLQMPVQAEKLPQAKVEIPVPVNDDTKAAARMVSGQPPIGKAYIVDPNYPYTILMGSFQAVEPIKKTMNKLEALGYRTYVATIDLKEKGIWHRLLVGRFKSSREAQKMADEIKEYGDFTYVKVVTSDRASR